MLKDKTKEERIACGFSTNRTDILPFGLRIILQIMQHMGKNKAFLTSGSLRTSLALEYFRMI
jgi:exopolyphosphatase/pppGpp-phosphohydrolase